jgi:hypothetical protein
MRDICLACYSPAASGRMVAAFPKSTCPLWGYESDSSYETQARSTSYFNRNHHRWTKMTNDLNHLDIPGVTEQLQRYSELCRLLPPEDDIVPESLRPRDRFLQQWPDLLKRITDEG